MCFFFFFFDRREPAAGERSGPCKGPNEVRFKRMHRRCILMARFVFSFSWRTLRFAPRLVNRTFGAGAPEGCTFNARVRVHVCAACMCALRACVRCVHVCAACMCALRACVRCVHVCAACMCAKPPIAILTRSGAPEGLIVRLRFLFNPSGLAFGLLQKSVFSVRDQILAKNVEFWV